MQQHFRTRGERKCLNGGTHSSNHFSVKFLRSGDMQYFCFADQCQSGINIGSWLDSAEGIENICNIENLSLSERETFKPAVSFSVKTNQPVMRTSDYNLFV